MKNTPNGSWFHTHLYSLISLWWGFTLNTCQSASLECIILVQLWCACCDATGLKVCKYSSTTSKSGVCAMGLLIIFNMNAQSSLLAHALLVFVALLCLHTLNLWHFDSVENGITTGTSASFAKFIVKYAKEY